MHVAVGIVTERGKVFVTRREAGSHRGGEWEFPGGKLNPGEDVLSALKRELHEELGMEVHAARALMQVRHAYPGEEVLLDVWRVTAYSGAPRGREGQEGRWAGPEELWSLDFSAADWPIRRRLWLPSLYLITDSRRFGRVEFLARLERALTAGARLIQLREPHMNDADYRTCAGVVIPLCHRHGAQVILHAAPEWAAELGADGVHLTTRRLMELTARPLETKYWVAASCHNAEELGRAKHIAADFAVLSPVARTTSHPGTEPLGWGNFRRLSVGANLPVYALGGMRARDLPRARAAGAHGLAMISGVWDALDPAAEVEKISRQD